MLPSKPVGLGSFEITGWSGGIARRSSACGAGIPYACWYASYDTAPCDCYKNQWRVDQVLWALPTWKTQKVLAAHFGHAQLQPLGPFGE